MASYKDAAAAVLSEAGGPLSAAEITKRAMDGGILDAKGATPEASMGAAIYMEIKKLGEKSRFEKAGSATFKLRPRPDGPPGHADGEKMDAGDIGEVGGLAAPGERDDVEEKMDAGDIGAAGEHRVISELFFRGYDADKKERDKGIDIVASKKGRTFNVQVKTVTWKNGNCVTRIGKKPFHRCDSLQMYYVFVLRDAGNRLDFVTLSSKEIKRRIGAGDITENKAGYQTRFVRRGDKVFLGNYDLAQCMNDWDL